MSDLYIKLEARNIAVCQASTMPRHLLRAFEHGVLQHQEDVYNSALTNDIILDLAPTGTGKTKAGLSVINHNYSKNAIYIAPTNSLIEQQTVAAESFVCAADLPHVVKGASARSIKDWGVESGLGGRRSAEKLYDALRNPATMFDECINRPLLLVTNPDIFYYATFFAYNRLDKVNIASSFFQSFSTIIFDEFHLYDAKQLVSLLFYLAFSHAAGYFQDNRKIVLLTATPEEACDVALDKLASVGVKVSRIDGESSFGVFIPSQTEVHLTLSRYPDKDEFLIGLTKETLRRLTDFPDKNGAIILDSLDQINRLYDLLAAEGLSNICGRITGAVSSKSQRHAAAQKQLILATSTVDVGFNFERENPPSRQNLDWLLFTARDSGAFWQRIGRVGRVLGKKETNIPSEAIVYLNDRVWDDGLGNIDCQGGRTALRAILGQIPSMKRPFLDVYWKSEAFLEISRPLFELENLLRGLPSISIIESLYNTLLNIFGGKRSWSYYKSRLKFIKIAEDVARLSSSADDSKMSQISDAFGRLGEYWFGRFINEFVKVWYEESGEDSDIYGQVLALLRNRGPEPEYTGLLEEIGEFSRLWCSIWAPLFRFRDSLFSSLAVKDRENLLLDEEGETNLDPIHLLRFYEFVGDDKSLEVTGRAERPYLLSFTLKVESLAAFNQMQIGKLWAYKLGIKRECEGVIRPTKLPSSLQRYLDESYIPGVVIKENSTNGWALRKLRKQGLQSYTLKVVAQDSIKQEEYLFFPTLAGILTLAQHDIARRLTCPDDEDFFIA